MRCYPPLMLLSLIAREPKVQKLGEKVQIEKDRMSSLAKEGNPWRLAKYRLAPSLFRGISAIRNIVTSAGA